MSSSSSSTSSPAIRSAEARCVPVRRGGESRFPGEGSPTDASIYHVRATYGVSSTASGGDRRLSRPRRASYPGERPGDGRGFLPGRTHLAGRYGTLAAPSGPHDAITRSIGRVSAAAAFASDPTEKSPPAAAATTARTSSKFAAAARFARAL